jgi:hypothetical protein
MEFNYNSTRPKLLYAEYGRNIQNMVKFIHDLPTKEERNRHAQAVIDLMGFLNPHLRDVTDFKHKLWDHLFIIADFQLDVDSPYPIPSRETFNTKPQKVRYPSNHIKFKHYGKSVEMMIEKAKSIEEPEKKSAMTAAIANFMKMAYVTWNKDNVSDETIINDLKALSNGELVLDENTNLNRFEFKAKPVSNPRQNNHKNKNNGRGGRDGRDGRDGGRDHKKNNGGKRY